MSKIVPIDMVALLLKKKRYTENDVAFVLGIAPSREVMVH